MMAHVRVIGGGLAGSECALMLARRGHTVDLVEMRPGRSTPAHQTGSLAELVCSNSFRSTNVTNAVGLLKRELEILGSPIMAAAASARIPAGDAFAVDRERFAARVTGMIGSESRIEVVREEATDLDFGGADWLVVATGPLTSPALHEAIRARVGDEGLYFYDAIAPIIAADSLDFTRLYWKSRYDKGAGSDYLNAPMTREEYAAFHEALLGAELYPLHDFENAVHFEGCLPIEEIASRGIDTLRYGPMKPVGLEHPDTGATPWAVVQLRKEDLSDEFFNVVGFQTKMTIPSQKKLLQMIPGLENCSVARWGSMHRNTFLNGPRHLTKTFRLRGEQRIFFAGQITGVEGYLESAATGHLVARYLDEAASGIEPVPLPSHTAIGALGRHVADSSPERYQPSNVTWALIEDATTGIRKKILRREAQVRLALEAIERISESAYGAAEADVRSESLLDSAAMVGIEKKNVVP
ncbi:MAG TPA: methylenetetrahydrofolate--tRNA-(uracil(54)-C(5))-methyltransferase (FADH(2)-oxidizing) TrmFO [Thermoanaerobaculia bacterium]|nr:methylenetetrahydrofolate--tRNA-(uracil(54)-C(5))-methyltransferase (FADH(2)-oxidizing) TrmFO [Thermoanaerobaculia bacterium]